MEKFTEKDLNKMILDALKPQVNIVQKLIQQKRELDGGQNPQNKQQIKGGVNSVI